MSQPSDDMNYSELKAELRELYARIEDLNSRLQCSSAPAAPPSRLRMLAKIPAFCWPMALGLLALFAAVAQTSDPITVGADGKVRIGKPLDVAAEVNLAGDLTVVKTVTARNLMGDGSGLTVDGNVTVRQALKNLNDRIDSVQTRISGIRLTESQMTTLPQFACGKEAIASTPFTYAVGSRDGTSCNVFNLVYVKTIGLSIPK